MSLTLRHCCLLVATLLAAVSPRAHAATFVVTNTADSGAGSLRAAIGLANINGTNDTISFAAALAGQTIRLTTGELFIDEPGTSLIITADGLPGGIILSGNQNARVIYVENGATAVLRSLTVTEGRDDYGSGIVSGGNVALQRCLITRNIARSGQGAGLHQYSGFLSIEQTTFSDNIAMGATDCAGAGLYLSSVAADIVNSTFSGNLVVAAAGTAEGGAIYQTGGGVSVRHCTFTGNRAIGLSSYGGAWLVGGLGEAAHSIFAGNEAIFGPELYTGVSRIHSAGHNFIGIGPAPGLTNGVNGDRAGIATQPLDPRLGPLQFNGGLAPTHAPLAGSPVIDVSTNTPSAPDFDQRGVPRLADGRGTGQPLLDMGAVEAGPSIFVTSAGDNADGLHLGGVSLREALANAAAPGTRILFDAAAFSQPWIELDPLKGPLVVRHVSVSIDASALPAPLTISGGNSVRILEVSNGAVAALTGLRLANGKAATGGGLRAAAGSDVSLNRCEIVSCVATNGGGAIASAGRLHIQNSHLHGNATTRGHGGAIDNTGGTATLFNSVLDDNTAAAGHGGAIRNASGAKLRLAQCAVLHNSASGGGGGIHSTGTNAQTEIILRHSTIAFNVSGQAGGGIASSNLLRSTHTLIACNRRGAAPDDFAGAATSEGYNLLGRSPGSSGFTASTDRRDVDARLRAFDSPFGLLHAPEPGSPAVEAGFNTTSPTADNLVWFAGLPARDLSGLARVAKGAAGSGLRVDIGAVELQAQRSFATNEVPWPIPGRIEAEDFDAGGPGVAYSDTTPANSGGAYRPDDEVDLEATSDTGGGFNVTSTDSGEWQSYTVEARSSGRYTLLLRTAADGQTGALRVEIDGADQTGDITIPDTGGDWTTLARTGIELTAGRHVLRVVWGAGSANLNFIEWQAEDDQRGLTRLLYLNRGGALISDFYSEPRGQANFPAGPEPFGASTNESGRVNEFETPPDLADSYGVVLAGYVRPSQSGWYSFYLCADNEGELWLSDDENPARAQRIATEPTGNAGRTWVNGLDRPATDGRPASVSAPVFLEASKRYYVEAVAKEGDGGDNLAVTWQRAGDPAPTNGAPPLGPMWLRPLLGREPATLTGNDWFTGVPRITPTFQSINPAQPGAFVEFRALAFVVGPVSYEWLLNGSPVAGTNFSGTNSAVLKIMNPSPVLAGFYTVILNGTNVSAPALLGVQDIASPDTNAPLLVVTSPAPAVVTVSNAMLTLAGTATDNRGLLAVFVSGDGFTNRLATGTTNWSWPVSLGTGTNRFFLRALDLAGNSSVVLTRVVILSDTNRLIVTVNGLGNVSPNLTNAALVIGRTYSLTATPRPGQVFVGWSDGIASSSNVLRFRMSSGLSLRANFIASPFTTRKGSYNGLFYAPAAIRHESSGFITATVTDLGAFSGRLTFGGKTVPFSGRFAPGGLTQLRLPRAGAAPLTLELRLPTTGGHQIIGGLTDGSWVADLIADRAAFNATNRAPFATKHTLVIPAGGDSASPGGDSHGAATVSALGRVTFSGTLADGTALSQSAPIAPGGEWPFYAPLYAGKGSIIGWLTFVTNNSAESLGGNVSWIKPPLPSPKVYTNGFTAESRAAGSSWFVSATNRALTFSNAVVRFTGGNLSTSPLPFNVTLTAAHRFTHTNGAGFALTLNAANGLFTGTFRLPGTNTIQPFRGAVLQQADGGAGFFLNKDVSGRAVLEPAP